MNREDALLILRLSPDATISDAKKQMHDLMHEAIQSGQTFGIPRYKDAYQVIKDTDGQAVGFAEQYIAYDGFKPPEKREAPLNIQRIPPYEEAVIKSRIDNLPRRVSVYCIVTNQKLSCELVFERDYNIFWLKNPLPYSGDPLIPDAILPVMKEDIVEDGGEITFLNKTEERQRAEKAFYEGVDDELSRLAQSYSRATSLDQDLIADFMGGGNDPEFGHKYSCHVCAANHFDQCSSCGNAYCQHIGHSWPKAWEPYPSVEEPKKVPCPHCGEVQFFLHPHRKRTPISTSPPREVEITESRPVRKQAAALSSVSQPKIEHEERRSITFNPMKLLGKK